MTIEIKRLTNLDVPIFEKFAEWTNDPEIRPYAIPRFNERDYIEVTPAELMSSTLSNIKKRIYVVYDGKKPIGECSIDTDFEARIHKETDTAWISLVIGDKTYWGKGISKQIMTFLEAECTRIGLRAIELGVFEYNKRARCLYEQMGYEEIARIDNFVYNFGTWHTDIRMLKRL